MVQDSSIRKALQDRAKHTTTRLSGCSPRLPRYATAIPPECEKPLLSSSREVRTKHTIIITEYGQLEVGNGIAHHRTQLSYQQRRIPDVTECVSALTLLLPTI